MEALLNIKSEAGEHLWVSQGKGGSAKGLPGSRGGTSLGTATAQSPQTYFDPQLTAHLPGSTCELDLAEHPLFLVIGIPEPLIQHTFSGVPSEDSCHALAGDLSL